MPQTKKKPKTNKPRKENKTFPEVLTLAEVASYLRVSENAVEAAIQDQDLPGRLIRGEWRFLKSSIRDWLGEGSKQNREAWMALGGVWKDDPTLEELLRTIEGQRTEAQEDR